MKDTMERKEKEKEKLFSKKKNPEFEGVVQRLKKNYIEKFIHSK